MPPSRPVALLAVVCILAAGLAGCVGNSSSSNTSSADTSDEPGPSDGPPVPDVDGAATFDAEPGTRTVWSNGSVGIHNAVVGRFDTQDPDVDETYTDITEVVPSGTPVRVTAWLNYSESATPANPATGEDPFNVFVDPGTNPIYNESFRQGPGWDRTRARLAQVTDDPIRVGINHDMGQDEPETDYRLRIDVEVPTSVVPGGVPVAVDVPASASQLRVVPAGDDPVPAMAWGPDDAFLGRKTLDGKTTFPTNGSGEHVVVADGPIAVDVPGTEGTLRALDVTTRSAETRSLPPQGPASWTFDVDRVPMAVAARVQLGEAVPLGVAAQGFTVEIAHGNATLLTWDFAQELCSPFPCMGTGSLTRVGSRLASDLANGEHTVTVSYDVSAQMRVEPGVVTWER